MSAWGAGGSARSCDALLIRVERNDPTLEELVILPNKNFGAAQVERLANALATGKNTHLKALSASGHAIPSSSLQRLGRATRKAFLVRLAIGDSMMGDEGVEALCCGLEGSLIQELDLVWKDVSADGMAALGRTFGPSRSLRILNLSRNERIKNDGIAALCTSASNRCSELGEYPFSALQVLDVAESGIDASGAQSLFQLLMTTCPEERPPLSLTLSGNPLGHECCNSLATLLCQRPLLSSLFLAKCNIGDEGLRILSDAAANNTSFASLKTLDLSHNGITRVGASYFGASLLSGNGTAWSELVDVRLAGNNLKEEGVKALIGALTSVDAELGNQAIRSLDLAQTNCGANGAVAALQCQVLSSLRLFNNKIGSDGFHKLATCLQGGHSSLESLDLGGNDASETSVVDLLTALARERGGFDSKLRLLEIGGNQGGDKVEQALRTLHLRHPELDVARDRPRQQHEAT